MKILQLSYPNSKFPSMPCGLVLGNFDGVHRGHLALIEELKRLNKMRTARLPLGALCFAEHPSKYFGKPVPMLCDNAEKVDLFRKAGLQFVIFCDFAELKDLSPEDFVMKILIENAIAVWLFAASITASAKRAPVPPRTLHTGSVHNRVVPYRSFRQSQTGANRSAPAPYARCWSTDTPRMPRAFWDVPLP